MTKRKPSIGVIGGGEASEETLKIAYDVGKYIAGNGAVLVSGGLGGVMEAASRGAAENGGVVVGIIPGLDMTAANDSVSIVIPSGMGHARNAPRRITLQRSIRRVQRRGPGARRAEEKIAAAGQAVTFSACSCLRSF